MEKHRPSVLYFAGRTGAAPRHDRGIRIKVSVMRYVSLAFTGYRTEKLPPEPGAGKLKEMIAGIIRGEAERGVKYFMSGVCHGADLIAADAVLGLREELGIELWCAVPFLGHRDTIPRAELELYDRVLESADGSIVLCKRRPDPSEFGRLYNERNRFMVQRCDGLIAICPGHDIQPGGTKNTVEMARHAGKNVIFVL